MFRKLYGCTSIIRRRDVKYLSVMTKTKSLVGCGLSIMKDKYNRNFFGPTGFEVTKDIDLLGKKCLITGANSGIGLDMTRCLNSRHCEVLMACRNTYAANVVAKNICEDNERLQLYEINLASLKSVKKCSDQILKDHKKIDIVILNAAVFGLPWILTEDNLETTFQVNYLSQYYLLMNIEKSLAPDARIVFVSSESHRNVNWTFLEQLIPGEELISLPKNKYTSIKAYNVSKLCGLLAMHYLEYRWKKTNISVFAAHPGSFVKTRLCRNWRPYELLYTACTPFTKSVSQAASTPLYCATSPDLKGHTAEYFKDCRRIHESDMASDFHLTFRMNELTMDLINERTNLPAEEIQVTEPEFIPEIKDTIEETLTPELSAQAASA